MTTRVHSQPLLCPLVRPEQAWQSACAYLRRGPRKTKIQRFPSATHSSDAAADRNSVPRRCGAPKNRASTCAMQWASWVEHVHGAPANWFVHVMALAGTLPPNYPARCSRASSDTSAGAHQLIVPRRLTDPLLFQRTARCDGALRQGSPSCLRSVQLLSKLSRTFRVSHSVRAPI